MTWLFLVLILGGVGAYFMTPKERVRALRALRASLWAAREGVAKRRADHAGFYDELRERTSVPFVTVTLLLLHAAVYFQALRTEGPVNDPATLVSWGANFGPLTSNGEWWRLLAAPFVHESLLEWLLTVACLTQVGLVLERLAGHGTVAVVYLSAGAFASLVSLTVAPVALNVGGAGALIGLYGLLLSVMCWGTLHRGAGSVPWKVLTGFVPLAAVFMVYQVFAGSAGGWVELAGFTTGLVSGVVLTRGISDTKPPTRRIAVVASAAIILGLASTFPLRGITDARPEVDRVVAAEARLSSAYLAVVVRFNEGLVPASALTRLIERQILPEIRTTRERLEALTGVPREHRPMLIATQEYLRLREESWRLRRDALQKTNMGTLRKADRTEWQSLQAFKRIRSGA